ncbi:MAG: hypothetical protein WCJ72_18875 [Chryseobacterium sp.]
MRNTHSKHYVSYISEHAYSMPSTTESLGVTLADAKETISCLSKRNEKLSNRNTKLKTKVKSLQESLSGTVPQHPITNSICILSLISPICFIPIPKLMWQSEISQEFKKACKYQQRTERDKFVLFLTLKGIVSRDE